MKFSADLILSKESIKAIEKAISVELDKRIKKHFQKKEKKTKQVKRKNKHKGG